MAAKLSQNHYCVRATHCAGGLLTLRPNVAGPPGAEPETGGRGGQFRSGGEIGWSSKSRAGPA